VRDATTAEGTMKRRWTASGFGFRFLS